MPTYLVFRELPGVTRDQFVAAQCTAVATAAAARAAGQPVWYLRGFFLPARATALCMFEGPDAEQVRAVNQQARVPFTDVVEAIELPSPPPQIQHGNTSHDDEMPRDGQDRDR